MNRAPRISIVTPSFNDAAYLEKTIRSVLEQGYPNLEYIIVDGGSTDGSVEIIRKYEHSLAWWCSEPDGGMYDAINKGFNHATGEIMGWINSDDIHHPGSLFILAELFGEHENVNWVQGIPNVVDERGRVVYINQSAIADKYWFYLKRHVKSRRYIQQESTFWRRSLWEKAGGYVSSKFKYAGDFELWLRFFKYDRIVSVPALLGAFRLGAGEQASIDRYQEYVNETFQALELHPLDKHELTQLKKIERLERSKRFVNAILRRLYGRSISHSQNLARFQFDHQRQKFVLVGP